MKINAVSKVEYENQVLKTERSRKDLAVLKDSKEDLLRSLELNLKNADNLLKIRKNDIKNYQLRAKGESQILKMYHEEGQYIRRGELLAEMGRGKYIVKLFVEESEINRIDKGQKLRFQSTPTRANFLLEKLLISTLPLMKFSSHLLLRLNY